MGTVSLPSAGRVYIDVPILIYSVERHPTYAAVLHRFWRSVAAGAVRVVVSELAILETMVLPLRLGDRTLIRDYESLFARPEIELRPIDRDVLREAAAMRAALPSLRTPDAIHGATARLAGCDVLLSNDRSLKRLPGIAVILADELSATDGS
jgi:predicted nucleic acid-binding protein